MDWHLITGSKGGVGKTLLSLLLSSYFIENNDRSTTLVIDLNSMNADFSRLLRYKKTDGDTITIFVPVRENETEQIIFQKTFSIQNNRPYYYVVGWSLNPFRVYDSLLFANLVKSIKESAGQIAHQLKLPELGTVIIDSNYHFCNIFSTQDIHYRKYRESPLLQENIFIWFMWVYRQLENLILSQQNDVTNDVSVIKLTVDAIERNINNHLCEQTVFMHVFGPAALLSSSQSQRNRGLADLIYRKLTNNQDIYIEELEQLERLNVGNCINFNDWQSRLRDAYITASTNVDKRNLFLEILVNATLNSSNNSVKERPKNIIPLSIFHHKIMYYTDGNYNDVISEIRGHQIYQNFSKLIQ